MNKLLKRGFLLLLMFTTTLAYTNELGEITKEVSENATTISFINNEKGSLIKIMDYDGIILYSETLSNKGVYSKGFDLTSLPDADYYFEIENTKEINIVPFTVISSKIEFEGREKKIVKPFVAVRGKHVIVSSILTESKSLSIDIFYEGYDLAYSLKAKNVESFSKVFDFSTSNMGNYIIVFEIDGKRISKSIKI